MTPVISLSSTKIIDIHRQSRITITGPKVLIKKIMVMKSNNQHDSRGENARNEERDSHGRFKSEDNKQHQSSKSGSSHTSEGRGSYAEEGQRDSHGRLESKGNHYSQASHNGRGSNAKNEPRDSNGRFTSQKKNK